MLNDFHSDMNHHSAPLMISGPSVSFFEVSIQLSLEEINMFISAAKSTEGHSDLL